MIQLDTSLQPKSLETRVHRLFELSAARLKAFAESWNLSQGAPVFTVRGIYTPCEWTDWTRGFLFGSSLLQFDATGEAWFLEYARNNIPTQMARYVSHVGVHDHGFNIVSTFGNLLRLSKESKFEAQPWEREYSALALKVSGAIQAARWTRLADGRGFIYSFSGPHSLFADTMRSLRSLALAHQLGHALLGEGDRRISLLQRLAGHASVTADYAVYYGEGRDQYDVRGRVAHESIFNIQDGSYRCPATQQGYSPFTTWMRGLAWALLGFAEELEFLRTVEGAIEAPGGGAPIEAAMLRAAEATADYYLEQTPWDGVPFWDSGAPNLKNLGDCLNRPSDPFNDLEPVDSSAAAIAAQGLWRLGTYLLGSQQLDQANRYRQAALVIARTLFDEPYLAVNPAHQGLILHSVYHRPKRWDYVPPGRKIPCGEASMWGDYHARELALLLLREIGREPYLVFYNL